MKSCFSRENKERRSCDFPEPKSGGAQDSALSFPRVRFDLGRRGPAVAISPEYSNKR